MLKGIFIYTYAIKNRLRAKPAGLMRFFEPIVQAPRQFGLLTAARG